MKAFITITLLCVTVLLSGCLGSKNSGIAPTLAFAYVVGAGDNSIRAFTQTSVGDLLPFSVASFPTNPLPTSLALHPSKNFLYVNSETANTVSGFNIDHTTGIITPIGTAQPPTPVCASVTVCSNPIGVAVDSAGHFLLVLNQGSATPAVPASISVFSIDTTRGLLTPVAGSPFPFASLVAPAPQFLIASPTSEAFYVSNGVSGTVSGFVVGANGVPSEVAGSPFATEAGATLAGMAIDPKGQFLFVADSVNNSIASFNVASNGALTTAAGSPVAAGTTPVAVAVDGTSAFLYSANQGSDNVSAYSISSGSLTPLAGSPFTLENSIASHQPAFITVDVSNAFLYVANPGTSNVTVFGRANDGTIQITKDSPFPTTVKPEWMVITK